MKITVTSVLVDDQDKALAFTPTSSVSREERDPLGEHRRLTVVSPDAPDGVELGLDKHPAVKPFKAGLVEDGIPLHLLRRGRCPAGVRPPARPRSPLHAGAGHHGSGDDGGAG